MSVTNIGDALFTKAQQKLLALFFGQPERSFYLNEIVRIANMGKGAITRELHKLKDAGLLMTSQQGNQIHYQANTKSPIFHEIASIVKKTFGIAGLLQTALTPLLPQLESAFVYGSVARGEDHADSDVDVMLVGNNLSYSEVMVLIEPAEEQLQRTINPTIYSPTEFATRLAEGQNFLTKVMEQPRIDLMPETQGE
jgi:predicted nucleotidyltransferase